MKAVDIAGPNRLLAVTTGASLALLIASATVFAPLELAWRYLATFGVCLVAYLGLSAVSTRWLGQARPLIQPGLRGLIVMAGLLPLLNLIMALLPLLWPETDYGLAIIIGTVLFGLTLRSAWAADRITTE